ncbi:MAG: OmpA/MotB domain-containing protein, partial [Microgenomates group bacterium Gr01-1014_80]
MKTNLPLPRNITIIIFITVIIVIFAPKAFSGHLGDAGYFCEGGDIVFEDSDGSHEYWQGCGSGSACVQSGSSAYCSADEDDDGTANISDPDIDGDGIGNGQDGDDYGEETYNGCKDSDGVPDQPSDCGSRSTQPTPPATGCTDSDGDGNCDTSDQCDYTDEDIDNCQDFDGCPEPPSACQTPTYGYPTPSGPISTQTYYICNPSSRSCSATTTPTAGSYGDISSCNRACNQTVSAPTLTPFPPTATLNGSNTGYVGGVLHFRGVASGVNLSQLLLIREDQGILETLASRTCSGTNCGLDFDWVPEQEEGTEGGIDRFFVVAFDEDGDSCSGNPARDGSYSDCDPSSDYVDVTVTAPPISEAPTQPGSPPSANLSGATQATVGDQLTLNATAFGSDLAQIGIWLAKSSDDLSSGSSWYNLTSTSCSGSSCNVSVDWVPGQDDVGSWTVVVNVFGGGGQCSGNPSRNPSIWTECSNGEADLVRINISPQTQVTTQATQTCTPGELLGFCKKGIGDEICVNSANGPVSECIVQAQPITPQPSVQTASVCNFNNLGASFNECHEGVSSGVNKCVLNSQFQPVLQCILSPETETSASEEEVAIPTPTITPSLVEPTITSLEATVNGSNYDLNGQTVPFGSRISLRANYPLELGSDFVCRWNMDSSGDS